jgi:hypothetical protein
VTPAYIYLHMLIVDVVTSTEVTFLHLLHLFTEKTITQAIKKMHQHFNLYQKQIY